MACSERRESRKPCGQSRPASSLLGNQNLVKETDLRVAHGIAFSLMYEFVKSCTELARAGFFDSQLIRHSPCVSLIMTAYSCWSYGKLLTNPFMSKAKS